MEKQEIYAELNSAYFSEDCHEKGVLDYLCPLLARARVFVDLGASLGQYTEFASRVMPDGASIVAVEADPIRFEELERNAARWMAERSVRITPVHAAICDSEAPQRFYTTESNVSGGLFAHPVAQEGVSWKEIEVPGGTLDGLLDDTRVDLVKMDVEGCELRVLRGAMALIERGQAEFLIEVHPWEDPSGQRNAREVIDWMSERGYRMTRVEGKCHFHRHPGRALLLKARRAARRLLASGR